MGHSLPLGFVAIGVGAAMGAWARWGLSIWLNARLPHFPLGTLAANLIGGFLVGVGVAYFSRHTEISPVWRMLAITGFLGGLTTFSTYSAEVIGLIEAGDGLSAFLLAFTHLAGSLLLTAAGMAVYRQLAS